MADAKHEYEPFGRLKIIRGVRHGRPVVLIRARYRPMIVFCFLAGCGLIALGYFTWAKSWTACISLPGWGLGLLLVALGPMWFCRGDWLLVDGDDWHFRCRVAFEGSKERRFTRESVVGLVIDREPKENGNYGLKLRLQDEELLLFSHGDVERIRDGGRRVAEALELGIEERL